MEHSASGHDLTSLLSKGAGATVTVPAAESVAASLHARYRQELFATYLADSTLVQVNPGRPTQDVNDESARRYLEGYEAELGDKGPEREPHVYDLATRVYLTMRRTAKSQGVVYGGIGGSGKSESMKLFTLQLARLSSLHENRRSPDETVSELLPHVFTLLRAFTGARTSQNAAASRASTVLETHFSAAGAAVAAKVLVFALDRSRLRTPLPSSQDRTFDVFYSLIAGASAEERAEYALLDEPAQYDLLASSGLFRHPDAPEADEMLFRDVLTALKALGFKSRHIGSLFRLLSAVLLLGNLEFGDNVSRDFRDQSAFITNKDATAAVASLLGVPADELERTLTNKVQTVKKETVTVLLRPEGARKQRDDLMTSLYGIIVAYVFETVNHRLFPGDEAIATLQSQGGAGIIQFDSPGLQGRTEHLEDAPSFRGQRSSTLLDQASTFGASGYADFCVNHQTELAQAWLFRRWFAEPTPAELDGVSLPRVDVADSASARLELLRGGVLGGKADTRPGGILGGLAKTASSMRKGKYANAGDADNDVLDGMRSHFASHTSFISRPSHSTSQGVFGISHWASAVSYDVAGFVDEDLGLLDVEFVNLLRQSDDSFVARLLSGPSLAVDRHPYDQSVIVAAQVSSQPLRRLSPVVASDRSDIDTTEPFIDRANVASVSQQVNACTSQLIAHLDTTRLWHVACIRPHDGLYGEGWDSTKVASQIRALRLPELTARRRAADYVAGFDAATFCARYRLAGSTDASVVRAFADQAGWAEGKDFAIGRSSVWLGWTAFKSAEDRIRRDEPKPRFGERSPGGGTPRSPERGWGDLGEAALDAPSQDDVLSKSPEAYYDSTPDIGKTHDLNRGRSVPNMPYGQAAGYSGDLGPSAVWGSAWDGDQKGGSSPGFGKEGRLLAQTTGIADGGEKDAKTVEEVESSTSRRIWVNLVSVLTWWIPTFAIAKIGRIKRPDMQMAWREKLAICELICLMCGFVVFYIIGLGVVLCPNKDNAWDAAELLGHDVADDYYVAVRGTVYDLTKFWRGQHSDILTAPVTQSDMLELGGLDLSNYFPVPLEVGCPNVQTPGLQLQAANWSAVIPNAVHTSGSLQTATNTALDNARWYPDTFLPYMEQYRKGQLVVTSKDLKKQADDGTKTWAVYRNGVYDLTDYVHTQTVVGSTNPQYTFIDPSITLLFSQLPGQDITESLDALPLNATAKSASLTCLRNLFYVGDTDFRETPRCTVQNYLLLSFTIILAVAILVKFLAALQLGTKRFPELRDKFVICQVPCYTEDEESLKKTIDSLAVLKYDDKRKLIFVICDGMIVGSGNDRPTPRIVLDILGVEADIDPEPMLFQSIGEGSRQLNYAKVYSGLYEVDGHVVPYVVVVKVGKPSERSKPGNRGKRDSQIMLMKWLNRVHFDAPMCPLELEITHQIRNVIGVEPQLYEFLFTVDADTEVTPDSLNRLVSAASDDARIIGICGETKLSNEKTSWWTMIQVYEYYISHHLSKAFESLFGSVTCLPGCFTLYRIRTADKGRPLVVSHLIIDDYSEIHVDTLHKKNLFSLGEDRYFTTLLLKHFPYYKTKFVADACAMTTAPETWGILLSQRRRWINSTIHNLGELLTLKNMCGFCCFSMRFFVFIDLLGTIILPATTVYIVYLIVVSATGHAIPIISICILGAVYGLQAIIFLLKREWSLIFWLVIYLAAYPVYSFFLPIYSFWHMDDFSWGNTRIVVGEGKHKKVIADNDDDGFEPSMIPLRKFSDYQAGMWEEERKSLGRSGRAESVGGFSLASRYPPLGPGGPGSVVGPASVMGGLPHSGSAISLGREQPRSRQVSNVFAPPYVFNTGSPLARSPAGSVIGGPTAAVGPTGVSEFGVYPGISGPMMMPPGHASMLSLGGLSMMSGMPFVPPTATTSGPFMPSYPSMMSINDLHHRNMSMFSLAGQAAGGPASVAGGGGGQVRPVQTNLTADPTEDELTSAVRSFLSTQDLMQVTKRTAREAIARAFPNADLTARKEFINRKIDDILAGN